jgi:uncharacterized protein YggE
MVKTFVLVALAAALPVPASAQFMPPPARPVAGITVSASGAAKVQVHQVAFVALVRGNADQADVLKMLRGAGVENPSLGVEGAQIYPNAPTTVRGVVRDVSTAKLDLLGLAAGAYVRAHPGLTIESIRFVPPLIGCEAFEETARQSALAEARRKAAAIAAASGATLGTVRAVAETGGCPAVDDARSGFGPPPAWFDVNTLIATVTVYETVTYTLAGSGGERRHPL